MPIRLKSITKPPTHPLFPESTDILPHFLAFEPTRLLCPLASAFAFTSKNVEGGIELRLYILGERRLFDRQLAHLQAERPRRT